MNSVLIVTSAYAPLAVSGVYRVVKLAKYLPDFEWRPIVLRVHKRLTGTIDPSLNDDIPSEAIVHSVNDYGLHALTSLSANLFGKPVLRSDHGYFLAALAAGKKLVKQHNIKAIFLSAPPDRLPVLGLWLKAATGLPLITDFRDPPWHLNAFWKPKPAMRAVFDDYSKQVYEQSDFLIANTEPVRQRMINELSLPAEKVVTITNGYDEADYANIDMNAVPDRETMEFFHPGWVRNGPEMPVFLQGVKSFLETHPTALSKVRFVFTGRRTPQMSGMVIAAGFSDVIKLDGHMEHAECVKRMCASDVNLIIFKPESSPLRTPQKTYEYLRAGRPVLAMIDDGPARKILAMNPANKVCHPHDSEQIAVLLNECYQNRRVASFVPDGVDTYSRHSIAGQIATFLTQATSSEDH